MTRVDSSTDPAGCLEKGYHLVAEFISTEECTLLVL